MKIAIIGGIGSGKSEVLSVARELGLPTLDADKINAELLEDADYIAQIAQAFRGVVKRGKINRPKLAQLVFSDDEARERLNSLAHPRIFERINCDMRDPLVVEMPLLVECGAQYLFDEIIWVYTPMDLRMKRLAGRGMLRVHAENRMKAQADESALREVATQVIDNSLGIDELRKNAREIFLKLTHIR